MRLASIKHGHEETAAILFKDHVIPISLLNQEYKLSYPTKLFDLLTLGQLRDLQQWFRLNTEKLADTSKLYVIKKEQAVFAPLYRHPRKIWGIGLNYVEHASDLSETAPHTEPASFMKPDTTIIGPGDNIRIPFQSDRTTAEAELGVIIGKECRNIKEQDAPAYIAGYTCVIDMTAEDILSRNPRYLTRAKSFDSFFSFGPVLVTPDEVAKLAGLKVATIINGRVHRENVVSNMTFNPYFLVSFHSRVMTLLPGDIISTGTPGAAVISDGDVVECRIDGFESLTNTVLDLKLKA